MASSFLSKAVVVATSAALLGGQPVIADGTFYSQLEPCPQSCSVTGAESSNWTAYHDTRPLVTCENRPIVLDFAIHNPVRDAGALSIFACSGPIAEKDATCGNGQDVTALAQTTWSDNEAGSADDAVGAAKHAMSHLSKKDCSSDEAVTTFGYLNGAFFGIYSGGHMQVQAGINLARQFIDNSWENGLDGDLQLTQVCGDGRSAESIVGIVAATPGEAGSNAALASVQKAVQTWSQGQCVTGLASSKTTHLKVSQKHPAVLRDMDNSNATAAPARRKLVTRDECRTIKVFSGNGCAKLAERCGISGAKFMQYNDEPDLCSTLRVGQHVCCSPGTLPDFSPEPNPDGSCATHLVQSGEWCSKIAAANAITVDDIESFNKDTWGWMGCDNLQAHMNICLSKGTPPMPAPISNAICGPQVPGTQMPTNGTDLAELNPCPLNACCDKWGQCGITKEFCTKTESPTGAPGTSKPGTNGCISDCGTDVVPSDAPGQYIKLGYFESWNSNRPCLNMDVRSLQGYDYNVVHFAFGGISDDWDVDVSAVQDDFDYFAQMPGDFKKIISFGGWSFSTSQDSYPIFRQGVQKANRQTFAKNVVAFVKKHNLDGADFDWEYPGVSDFGLCFC